MSRTVKLWKSAIYAVDSDSRMNHPSGDIMKELEDSELDRFAGAGTANTVCACESGEHSCGRLCTGTTECPIMTIICC
ncbi:MAG: plantaricin C family lantibiotic [Anaerotignum sp.]|nr:plantaricin C family lantibiotic [Anaerotignum sp.]